MTGQGSQSQRRRATRSTALSTATSTTITTSTQIHSAPGMAPLLHRAATAGRNTDTPARWWLPARNGLPAALAGGTLHPPAPAVACWTGCHLAASAVKGRCALMSARSACGRLLTLPGPA